MPVRCDSTKVREKMEAAGFTVAKLVAISGVSASTINRVLNNKAHAANDYTLQQIADALSCSPYELMSDETVAETIQAEALQAVVEVVTETVSADGHIPPIAPGSTLDIPAYVQTIVDQSNKHLGTMRQSRDTWRTVSCVLFAILVALIWYFAWEIFNPTKGITSILWDIYGQGGL